MKCKMQNAKGKIKKLAMLFVALVLMLQCGATAFAAEADSAEIGVYAKSQREISGEYTAKVENGAGSVITDDDVSIAVTDAPSGAVTLVVILMEGEAKAWVDTCVDGNVLAAYDIHFLDAQGNRINANGAKVSITASGSDLTVSSVNTSGEDKALTSTVSDGKVSFTTDGSHYYAIAQPQGGGDEPGPGDTVTVPVRGDENEIHAEVTINGDTVELHELDFEEIDHVVGDHVKTGIVKIDLTGLDDDVTKVILPVTTVEYIVEAAEEANNDTEALQVDFPSGSVKLDVKTMRAVVEQAECNEVMLVLESVGETRLNDKQMDAIADMNVYAGFEAYLLCVSTNKRISDFEGGVATLYVPFTVPAGLDKAGFTVWHISDEGGKEKLNTWFEGSNLCWDVGHFSDFIVVYEGTVETHSITVKDTQGGEVTVSTTTPKTGETVTITAKPDSGKVVDQVTVTDENGKAVQTTAGENGTYTFVQPNCDVTVEVTFKNTSSGDTPQTGDNSMIHFWWILLCVSVVALIPLIGKYRKENKAQK